MLHIIDQRQRFGNPAASEASPSKLLLLGWVAKEIVVVFLRKIQQDDICARQQVSPLIFTFGVGGSVGNLLKGIQVGGND